MGHLFGLDHDYSNTYSIMYPSRDGRKVYTVQKPDSDAFNYKHP
jgi:predicted Zn-dependent protease